MGISKKLVEAFRTIRQLNANYQQTFVKYDFLELCIVIVKHHNFSGFILRMFVDENWTKFAPLILSRAQFDFRTQQCVCVPLYVGTLE